MALNVARRMWALDSPTFTLESGLLMFGLSGTISIPMPAFLIEHPKGLVLFDTGMAPEGLRDPVETYGEQIAGLINLQATEDQQIDRQLQQLGYRIDDVTHVVASHLHFDHAGAHHLFPNAVFYVGQGEFGYALAPDPIGIFAYATEQVRRIQGLNWRTVPGIDVDIFGDGSLVIMSMPGHTPGNLSLRVRLASRTFVLAGDAVHLRAALEVEYPTPFDHDSQAALATLRRLKRIRESDDATIWITHDPEDFAELGHAPTCYE